MIQKGYKISQDIDSDSSSNSSEENLDQVIQSKLKIRAIQTHNQSLSVKSKTCIAVLFISLMLALLVYFRSLSHENDLDSFRENEDHKRHDFPDDFNLNRGDNLTHQVVNIPALSSLNETTELQNAIFLSNIVKNVTNHWFLKQLSKCIPNHIVNSATKIDKDTYAQATAYENVNILTHQVDIPASQLYRFEAPRQFMHNVSLTFKNKNVVYDHHSPLLLVLIIRQFQKGIFVSTRNNWPLLQKNLVFNDLLPLANPYPLRTLIDSQQYEIIVTHDLELAIQLLIQKKRQVIVVIDFAVPTKVKTSYLLWMKLYKLDDGVECHERGMRLFEEGSWRIDEQAYILPGWYVLTDPNRDLSFGEQLFNYQVPLITEEDRQCKPTVLYTAEQGYFSGSKKNVQKLPFFMLNYFSKDALTFSRHFRGVYGYLNQKTPQGLVFLDSGSMYLLLVVIWTLPSWVQMYITEEYPLLQELIKHLVLNSQEKVRVIDETSARNKEYQMIITDDIQKAKSFKTQKIIFQAPFETNAFPEFTYQQLVEDQCKFPTLDPIQSSILPKGIYLLSRKP